MRIELERALELVNAALEPIARQFGLTEHAPHFSGLLDLGCRLVQDLRRLAGIALFEEQLRQREIAVEALGREFDRLAEQRLGTRHVAHGLLGLAEREHDLGVVWQLGAELGQRGFGLRALLQAHHRAADAELGFGVRCAAAQYGRVVAALGRRAERGFEARLRVRVALLAQEHASRTEQRIDAVRIGRQRLLVRLTRVVQAPAALVDVAEQAVARGERGLRRPQVLFFFGRLETDRHAQQVQRAVFLALGPQDARFGDPSLDVHRTELERFVHRRDLRVDVAAHQRRPREAPLRARAGAELQCLAERLVRLVQLAGRQRDFRPRAARRTDRRDPRHALARAAPAPRSTSCAGRHPPRARAACRARETNAPRAAS